MRLSAARCAVCEDGSIVSVQDAVKQWLRCRLVHVALRYALIEDAVECEGLILYSLPLRKEAFRESLYGVVFWWIEYSKVVSVSTRVATDTGVLSYIQALLIYDFDDGANALRMQLGCRKCC